MGGSSRCRSPRWGVRSLRSVSPRLVAPSAPSLERGQSLCGHRCAPFGLPRSPRPPSSPLRSVWAGCERPRVVRSLLPCGVFVVRGSLAFDTIASPSARLLVYICKVKFTNVYGIMPYTFFNIVPISYISSMQKHHFKNVATSKKYCPYHLPPPSFFLILQQFKIYIYMNKETIKTIINFVCTVLSAIASVICTSSCVPKIV